MNEKRSCPGRPNKYSTTLEPIVIRPKSSATVVVVLLPTPDRSSRPTLAVVRVSSVRSGRTSLIAPTSVVFPEPNPPAMRILCAVNAAALSECAEPIQYLLEHVIAGSLAGRSLSHYGDRSLQDQVGEQYAYHAQGQRGVGGEVGHGDLLAAHAEDPAVLRGEPRGIVGRRGLPGTDDDGEEVEHLVGGGFRPAAGYGVRPHHRAGVTAPPLVARRHGDHSTALGAAGNLGSAARCGRARLASIAIS